MKSYQIEPNSNFIGRNYEQLRLAEIASEGQAAIVVIYGRRRVGKTELIEQSYAQRNIIKLEGIEGRNESEQRKHVLLQIAHYMDDPAYALKELGSWTEVFDLLATLLKDGVWTLYFEEVQWLADYKTAFIAELKYVWDNQFRHNSSLLLILCGSSPSFMINQVMHSKALYNRSQFEIHLSPLPLLDAKKMLAGRSNREVMDAYLTVGGMPEYLKRIHRGSSTFLALCEQSFTKDGFFSTEYKRIFISSLANSPHYQKIIEFLSQMRFATRAQIAKYLGIKPGGTLSVLINDLCLCGFIDEYTSYHLPQSPSLVRYAVSDNYLVFYFKFIKPIANDIAMGKFNESPTAALKHDTYYKWLGYSFERFCRRHDFFIAKLLGFSGVSYRSGAYFSKRLDKDNPGFQIELLFDRADQVLTVCEIKYTQTKVDLAIIDEFERKLALLPNPQNRTIHKVLIAAYGATENLINRHYFDRIIVLDDFFV